MTFRYDRYKSNTALRAARLTAALALSSALVTACSAVNQLTGGDENEQSRTLDINVDEVSGAGCLNLEAVTQKLRSLPSGSVIREHTTDFKMAERTEKDTPVRRNMEAETAFANFSFDEKADVLFAADLPNVVQDGCASVEMSDQLDGKERFQVVPTDQKGQLHLKRVDGQKEKIYSLKGPRELEITTISTRIDRCPDFYKAKATTYRTRIWGSQGDIDSAPARVSASLLKKISIAVLEMPAGLKDLLYASDEFVQPDANDLRTLKAASLDPKISDCPYDASPPVGDEPPPAESDDAPPTIGPSPTPAPEEPPAPVTEPETAPTPPV